MWAISCLARAAWWLELIADAPPTRLMLLGEKLITFRDSRGRVAMLDHRCPHRCASLFLGRNENEGIRCAYHGWKFDVDGSSDTEEVDKVATFIRAVLSDGIEPAAVGLFVCSREEMPRARAAAVKAGVEATELAGRTESEAGRIVIGTMHFAKGLEFRAVAVMACDEGIIPAPQRVADVSDEMELDEVYATERQLYVAATRARDKLLISGVSRDRSSWPICRRLFNVTRHFPEHSPYEAREFESRCSRPSERNSKIGDFTRSRMPAFSMR